MALQDDIRELLKAGSGDSDGARVGLRSPWTARDLASHPSLRDIYAENYLLTQPANRSVPAPGFDHLGTGIHVKNGQPPLFLRVGEENGALLFELIEHVSHPSIARPKAEIRDDESDDTEDSGDSEDSGQWFAQITKSNVYVEQGDKYLGSDEFTRALLKEMRGLLGGWSTVKVAHCYKSAEFGDEWQCLGLLEAVERYRFRIRGAELQAKAQPGPFNTFEANSRLLKSLEQSIRTARQAKDESATVAAAKEIQKWGLPAAARKHNVGAIQAASALQTGFLGYLDLCEECFGTGTSIDLSAFIGSAHGLRSNAGFTKIYALAFDNFAIYDSRVMAALGMVTVRTLAKMGKYHIDAPNLVAGLWDSGRAANAQRNPNSNWMGIIGFPRFERNNPVEHLKWNIRANALLATALTGSDFEKAILADPKKYPVTPLRALEAALFMIGYDLGGNWPHYHQEPAGPRQVLLKGT